MGDPVRVQGRERPGERDRGAREHLAVGDRPRRRHERVQRRPVEALHDDVGHRAVEADAVDARGVVAGDLLQGLALAQEAGAGVDVVEQVRREHLDGHDAVRAGAVAEVDGAHAAGAEPSRERVLADRARVVRRAAAARARRGRPGGSTGRRPAGAASAGGGGGTDRPGPTAPAGRSGRASRRASFRMPRRARSSRRSRTGGSRAARSASGTTGASRQARGRPARAVTWWASRNSAAPSPTPGTAAAPTARTRARPSSRPSAQRRLPAAGGPRPRHGHRAPALEVQAADVEPGHREGEQAEHHEAADRDRRAARGGRRQARVVEARDEVRGSRVRRPAASSSATRDTVSTPTTTVISAVSAVSPSARGTGRSAARCRWRRARRRSAPVRRATRSVTTRSTSIAVRRCAAARRCSGAIARAVSTPADDHDEDGHRRAQLGQPHADLPSRRPRSRGGPSSDAVP